MSDLKDQLTEISGVGDATAEAILEVVEAHGESELPDEVYAAYRHAENGKANMAASYLAQVVDDE